MREEFVNFKGQTYVFTDTHFRCKVTPEIKSIPYDKISKIKLSFLDWLYIEGNDTVIKIFISNNYKSRVKELIGYVKKNPQYFYNNVNFREEFISIFNEVIAFTNVGIEYYSASSEEMIIDYKNMEPIVLNNYSFEVQEINKDEVVYIYNQEDKERIKNTIKQINDSLIPNEKTIRCNVCGHIFCYSKADIEKNNQHRNSAKIAALTTAAGALSGNFAAGAASNQTANDELARIIDYNRCPACGSRDLVVLTGEDLEHIKKQENKEKTSTFEELKNFKDLLDSGVITQEEFDAKKKQLLGL